MTLSRHTITEADVPGIIDAAKRGWGWCCHCGLPKIAPGSSVYQVRCPDCLDAPGLDSFCRKCGEQIDLRRRDYYKKHMDQSARYCRMCVDRKLPKQPCRQDRCGVYHPDGRPFLTERSTCAYAALTYQQQQ